MLDEKMVAFRNNVIHKGYLPSSEETSKYAEFVMRAIYSLIQELHLKYPDALRDVAHKNGDKAAAKVLNSSATISVKSPQFTINTILSINKGGQSRSVALPFTEALKTLKFIRSKLSTA